MSAPFVGRRVTVVGTSRADLNGQNGLAQDYDRDKGRYNVALDDGRVVSLKPANIQEGPAGSSHGSGGRGNASTGSGGQTLLFGLPWQQTAMLAVGAMWLYQAFFSGSVGGQGSGGDGGLWGAGDADVQYHDNDDGFVDGQVREISTLDQFRSALGHHGDTTGLPLVVDFYSHSCGPCRSIAPAYRRLAKELKGRMVFAKVDVNRNYETSSACRVHGMPTFQFYMGRNKVREFAGADERLLRRYSHDLLDMAEDQGTFVGQHVTAASLKDFYKQHDPAKVEEAERLAEKYQNRTALLVRVSQQKYGSAPKASPKEAGAAVSAAAAADKSSQAADIAASVDDEELVVFTSLEEVLSDPVQQVVVIGGGPAGLSAAIYTARAGLRPVVVAPAAGGQLLGKGVDVENFPGVVGEHASGHALVEVMRRQALSFDARFVDAAVVGVDFSAMPHKVMVNGSEMPLQSRAIILASGAESRWLSAAGEETFRGRGVSACATCDGYLYRGKDVAVIGGGDTAMEDALHLARTCRRVTVIHRRSQLRASHILKTRAMNHSGINFMWDSEVESFHGADELTHLQVRRGSLMEKVEVSGTFVAIGHTPQTSFLQGQVELDSAGYVALKGGTTTSVRGVFAAGDIADHRYRQAITASGSGAMAALDVEHFLNEDGS